MVGKVEKQCPICGDTYLDYISHKKATCGKANCVSKFVKRYVLPRVGVCSSCGKKKRLERKGAHAGKPPLCKYCLDHELHSGICKYCGKVRVYSNKDCCKSCYVRLGLNKHKVICKSCGENRTHLASGLCKTCYSREYMSSYHMRDYMRKYYLKNRERIIENVRRWRARVKEERNAGQG